MSKTTATATIRSLLIDAQGNHAAMVVRNLTTFDSEYYLLLPGGPKKLQLPRKLRVNGLLKRSADFYPQ